MKKTLLALFLLFGFYRTYSQCNGQLEPGFTFLTSSKGCSPFTVQIQTLFLGAVSGTSYRVDWGDGSAPQTVVESNATGVILTHTYVNSPVSCGYDVQIDAFNACNPLGSVIPVKTEVVVWNDDIVNISQQQFRVCEGFAATMNFTDNSTWNCDPRATRENNAPRWLQWKYGTGPISNQIPNVTVNGVLPGSFPYLNPAPNTNPSYPNVAVGSNSLTLGIPATIGAGKTFNVDLWNWNTCNAYDNNISDGNPFNPVNGNLITGDNQAQIGTAQVVIVSSPKPKYQTRLTNSTGVVKSIFCINDLIYFNNLTPNIGGSNFSYRWEFYDDASATVLLGTKNNTNPTFTFNNPGVKAIVLYVKDTNAYGNCETSYVDYVTINPVLQATISTTDFSNIPISGNFCQNNSQPFTNFNVRFHDVTPGVITITTQFRWEFYDNNNNLVFSNPIGNNFSNTQIPFIDMVVTNLGQYKAVLYVKDASTNCQSSTIAFINVTQNPIADFTNTIVCETNATTLNDASTLTPSLGDKITKWEWDLNYNNVTFVSNPSYLNSKKVTTILGPAGTYNVALRVTTSAGCSDMIVKSVKVLPLPIALFNVNTKISCSGVGFVFTNMSILNQPDLIDSYTWEINKYDGLGFQVDSIQHPTDPGFSSNFILKLLNNTSSIITYDIRLVVKTVSGCSTISPSIPLQIAPAPVAGYSALNYFPFNPNCSPVSVNFQADLNTIAQAPIDYTWIIYDNNNTVLQQTSTGIIPKFSYTFVDTTQSIIDFKIDLRTTFLSGCVKDSLKTIRINPVPKATFTFDTVTLDCNKLRLKIAATNPAYVSYDWKVTVDGVTIINTNKLGSFFEYDFIRKALSQNVSVSLVTTNFASCTSTSVTNNTTIPAITVFNADFTTSPISQFYPNTTFGINNLTNSGYTYSWDFGDGTTSKLQQPINHTYVTSGTYTIVLTVSDGYCSTQVSRVVTISPAPSMLDFTYNPASGCAPLIVTFTCDTLNIVKSTMTWQISNMIFTGTTLVQTFNVSGNYDITLTARDINGKLLIVTKTVNIVVNQVPNVLVVPSTQNVCDNTKTSISLYNPNNVIGSTYYWSVVATNVSGANIGSNSLGPIVDQLQLVNPTQSGVVKYYVNAVSNNCTSDTLVSIVNVVPVPKITASDTTICSGSKTDIKISSNIPATYNWTVGLVDGNVYGATGSGGTVIQQTLTTDQNGGSVQYLVSPSNSGCNGNSATVNVTVNPSPFAQFAVRSFVLYTDQPLYVSNSSTNATTYLWDFGDGVTSTDFEPTHLYTKTGQFPISLIAYNKIGCSDTTYLNTYIRIEVGGQLMIPNVFTPSGGVVGSQGINDTFQPIVSGDTSFEMLIYDRWGILMFESHNTQIGWDGTYNGKPAVADVYVYKITVKFQDGGLITKTGDFLLLR